MQNIENNPEGRLVPPGGKYLDLTPKQFVTLVLVAEMIETDGGRAPSVDEIASKLGVSVGAAKSRLRYLVARGYLVRAEGHRGLRLTELVGRFA